MAKFGFMGKALAGAGQGLTVAGELGYRHQINSDLEKLKAEITANRDAVLLSYEGRRADAQIASNERIATQARESQERIASQGRDAQREVAGINAKTHIEGIQLQVNAKGDNTVILPKGAKLIGKDGAVLAENSDGDHSKSVVVADGAILVGADGKVLYENKRDQKGDGLSRLDKDYDERYSRAQARLADLLGGKFDQMGQLSLEPGSTENMAWATARLEQLIRSNVAEGDAVKQTFSEVRERQARHSAAKPKSGEPSASTMVENFRKRFGY